jgi:hypothetical protein
MFDVTSDVGVFVGKGPSVSDAVTEHVPEEVVPPVSVAWVPSDDDDEELSSPLLQALITGMVKAPSPSTPNPLKNSFLSMLNTFFWVATIKVFKLLNELKIMR